MPRNSRIVVCGKSEWMCVHETVSENRKGYSSSVDQKSWGIFEWWKADESKLKEKITVQNAHREGLQAKREQLKCFRREQYGHKNVRNKREARTRKGDQLRQWPDAWLCQGRSEGIYPYWEHSSPRARWRHFQIFQGSENLGLMNLIRKTYWVMVSNKIKRTREKTQDTKVEVGKDISKSYC